STIDLLETELAKARAALKEIQPDTAPILIPGDELAVGAIAAYRQNLITRASDFYYGSRRLSPKEVGLVPVIQELQSDEEEDEESRPNPEGIILAAHPKQVSLVDVLSNSLILDHMAPYLSVPTLLALASTSHVLRSMIMETPYIFRHLDLTQFPGHWFPNKPLRSSEARVSNNERLENSLTEDAPHSAPLQRIFAGLGRGSILQDVRTLILDGLPVPADLVAELILTDRFSINILSIRECRQLNERKLIQVLQRAVRPSRPKGTPRVKGIYYFTPVSQPRAIMRSRYRDWWSSRCTRTTSYGALKTQEEPQSDGARESALYYQNAWYCPAGKLIPRSIEEGWAPTIQQCEGIISFDAVLCRGPRHNFDLYKSPGHNENRYQGEGQPLEPAIATVALGPRGVMSKESSLLRWSSSFTVTAPGRTPKLPGDKITLPQSALEQLLAAAPLQEVFSNRPAHPYTTAFDPLNPRTFAAESRAREQALERQHQLPHPLTFRIVNPKNGRAIYAGIREFSAEDNEVGLSVFLRDALGIEDNQFPSETSRYWQTSEPSEAIDATTEPLPASLAPELAPIVTVHVEQLPKGTYVRLRPLEAGYDPEDWKALLERYLRNNFTTLSTGEVLQVSGGRHESFRFLVDKIEPDGDGICIIDTDLEVDIVALTEDQARETYQRRLEKASRAIGTQGDSSTGGVLSIGEKVNGLVVPGTYVDYEIREWDRGEPIVITVESADDADVFLFISPLTARQRNRPREDQHLLGDFTTQPIKCIQIESTNVELETAEALYVSVYAFGNFEYSEEHSQKQELPLQYKLQISTSHSVGSDGDSKETLAHGNPNEIQCGNCQQWVPQQTLVLHESFCLRNNVLCPQCHNVFQKGRLSGRIIGIALMTHLMAMILQVSRSMPLSSTPSVHVALVGLRWKAFRDSLITA
ncbi:hypothetical protein APSETT445_008342, partial [Aspergillus pseudonomiae]